MARCDQVRVENAAVEPKPNQPVNQPFTVPYTGVPYVVSFSALCSIHTARPSRQNAVQFRRVRQWELIQQQSVGIFKNMSNKTVKSEHAYKP